jgi:CDP-L-myo-inositol myo-inositolphosphotransferase
MSSLHRITEIAGGDPVTEIARDYPGVPTVVMLAAGMGFRVASMSNGRPKPTIPVLGLSLAERIILTYQASGLHHFVVVLGYRADEVRAHVLDIAARRDCEVECVVAKDWRLGNGASALAASSVVSEEPFLLTMADHLIDPSLLEQVLRVPPTEKEICLAVDSNKEGLLDLEDVTKVQVANGRVVRIGKDLRDWNVADTGVFYCTRVLFEGIRRASAKGHYGLSDAVRELAVERRVRAVDVTGEQWIDMDDAVAFRHAKRRLLSSVVKNTDDGYVSAYLNRPLSLRLSSLLAKARISPNLITLVSFLLALGGAVFLSLQGYMAGLMGGLLVQFSSVVDGCDGEVARLRQIASPRGGWLDTILDRYAELAVVLAITFSYASSHPGPLAWMGGLLSISGYYMASYVTKEFALRHGKAYPPNFLNRIKRRDLRLLGISVGAVMGIAFEAMVGLGVLSHLCVMAILVQGWRQRSPYAPAVSPKRALDLEKAPGPAVV